MFATLRQRDLGLLWPSSRSPRRRRRADRGRRYRDRRPRPRRPARRPLECGPSADIGALVLTPADGNTELLTMDEATVRPDSPYWIDPADHPAPTSAEGTDPDVTGMPAPAESPHQAPVVLQLPNTGAGAGETTLLLALDGAITLLGGLVGLRRRIYLPIDTPDNHRTASPPAARSCPFAGVR